MSSDKFRLDGLTAIVTGASKGLGEGMAHALAGAGAAVVITSRNQAEGQLVADQIAKAGGKALALAADTRSRDAIAEMVRQSEAAFGKVDILVNNAGVGGLKAMHETDDKDFGRVIETNLKGCLMCAQAVFPGMVARKFGRIINVGSVGSVVGHAGLGAYVATKHGLLGLTRTMAIEWAPLGITVNCLCPGFFETRMTTVVKEDEALNATVLSRVPAGRWGQAEDLDTAVLFLASPASGFVTGISLCVDGGMTAQ